MSEGRVTVTKKGETRIQRGHPWIFRSDIERREGAEAGSVVRVLSPRNRPLGFAFFSSRSEITLRMIERGSQLSPGFLRQRLQAAIEWRRTIAPDAEAIRLVHGEGDGIPSLVVDKYGEYLVVQTLAQSTDALKPQIVEALTDLLRPKGILERNDPRVRELEGLPRVVSVLAGEIPETVVVQEGDLSFEADLRHGQKTGLFLDQRENRRRAEARAKGRTGLDLFCYQGEWAMHLARGGAEGVLAVDSSEPALALARANVSRNGLSADVEFLRMDAFDALRRLEREGRRFGIVVLDPPAMIKSRRAIAAGARAYREHNRLAMSLLEEDGILVSCSCSHHLDDDMFRQVLLEAARSAKRPMRVLDWSGEAPDHPRLLAVPETHYLKCAVLQAL